MKLCDPVCIRKKTLSSQLNDCNPRVKIIQIFIIRVRVGQFGPWKLNAILTDIPIYVRLTSKSAKFFV